MAVKLFSFLSRGADVDVESFHRTWGNEYGPELAEQPVFRDAVLRYEQNHRLAADYERARDPSEQTSSFDGCSVFWFESFAAFEAFSGDPELRRWSEARSGTFLDRSMTRWLVTREPDAIVDLPEGRERAGAKLLSVFRRNPALDREAFRSHWRERHGPLYVDVPALARDVLAYDQNPRLDADYDRDAPGAPGDDGVTEQWFESIDAFTASLRLPENRKLVGPDVAHLLDTSCIEFLITGWPQPAFGEVEGP